MKIEIGKIRVKDRIRKEISKIEELAEDIRQNGLISPIAVMPLEGGSGENGGEYQLLAGLRRLKAAQILEWSEIEANAAAAKDAEEILRIEISENEQREPFTFSERDYFRKLLEEIESAKAKERMSLGGKGGIEQGSPHGDTLERGRTSSIVAEKLGMKKTTYDRSKYISEHAAPEVIEQLDKKETSVRRAYDDLRAAEQANAKSAPPLRSEITPCNHPIEPAVENSAENLASKDTICIHSATSNTVPKKTPSTAAVSPKIEARKHVKLSEKAKEDRAMAMLSPDEREAVERNKAFASMTPEQKIVELQSRLKAERCRAVTAEIELARLKDELHNAVYHRDGIISSLERQLEEASAKIAELEGTHNEK